METLLEGIRASIQPCSLALVVPGLAATVLAIPRGEVAAATFVLAAWLSAWGQATTLLQVGGGLVVGVTLAVVASLGIWLLWRGDRWALLAGASLGVSAGLLWQPCVGPELGSLLTRAPNEPLSVLLPMGLYLSGLLISLAVVAAVPSVDGRVRSAMSTSSVRVVATIPLSVLVAVLATGQYERIIGALVRASSLA